MCLVVLFPGGDCRGHVLPGSPCLELLLGMLSLPVPRGRGFLRAACSLGTRQNHRSTVKRKSGCVPPNCPNYGRALK